MRQKKHSYTRHVLADFLFFYFFCTFEDTVYGFIFIQTIPDSFNPSERTEGDSGRRNGATDEETEEDETSCQHCES